MSDDRNRRAFDRWNLPSEARVIFESASDFSCKIKDMSANGVALDTAVVPELGDRCVVYVEGIGRLKAEVVRVAENDVALHFLAGDERQQAVLDRLERQVVRGIERRLQETLDGLEG